MEKKKTKNVCPATKDLLNMFSKLIKAAENSLEGAEAYNITSGYIEELKEVVQEAKIVTQRGLPMYADSKGIAVPACCK